MTPLLPVREGARVAALVRVSTDAQDTASQERAIAQLCEARGWAVTWHREHGVSGGRELRERPVLRGILDAAHRGEVAALVVFRLDRLTRRGPAAALALVGELARGGCRVVSVGEPWADASGPMGELLLSVAAFVASWEREAIRERTRAGLAVARAAGKRLGRPPADPERLARAVAAVEAGATVERAATSAGLSASRLRQALRAAGFSPSRSARARGCGTGSSWRRSTAQKTPRGATP